MSIDVIKNCQNCKEDFAIEAGDFSFYERIKVPPPTWCSECRLVRRFMFWNQHHLFRKQDAITGKEVFSTYPKDAAITIYNHDYWWGDGWDPMQYGRDYDFSRSFFEQFKELADTVPWPSRSIQQLVNSDFCNQVSRLKNCYLCFNGNDSEDSMYSVAYNMMRSCIDTYQSANCELCYEVFSAGSCYATHFSSNVSSCRNVWLSDDCMECSDCFGCVGLRKKSYHIFNVPYTKEEYEARIREMNLGSYQNLLRYQEQFKKFRLQFPAKYMHGNHNVDTTGDYVYWSKNVRDSYQVMSGENLKYGFSLTHDAKDSMDYSNWGLNSELMYEAISCGENCRDVKFCFDCWPACTALEYSMNCHSTSDSFGCVGLKKKQYCILNKQYTKEEYFALKERIIEQMNTMPYVDMKGRTYAYGEFFPSEFSPLSYNESIAQDVYPVTEEEAKRNGFLWREPSLKEFESTMQSKDIPDHIKDVNESVVREFIACSGCGRSYRILSQELEFYKRFQIPLPRKCHLCRYIDRTKQRNLPRQYERNCACAGEKSLGGIYTNTISHFHDNGACPNTFQTSYAPDRPEIVYCEACYNGEVV